MEKTINKMTIEVYEPEEIEVITEGIITQIKQTFEKVNQYFKKIKPDSVKVNSEDLGIRATTDYAKSYQSKCEDIYSDGYNFGVMKCGNDDCTSWGS